jgi:hypothetical protein
MNGDCRVRFSRPLSQIGKARPGGLLQINEIAGRDSHHGATGGGDS